MSAGPEKIVRRRHSPPAAVVIVDTCKQAEFHGNVNFNSYPPLIIHATKTRRADEDREAEDDRSAPQPLQASPPCHSTQHK